MNEWKLKFLAHLRAVRNVSAHTLRAYRADVSHFLDHSGAGKPADLDRDCVRAYIALIQSQGTLGRSSVLRRISALRSFIRYLRRESVLGSDPFANVPIPKKQERLPRFLSEKEMDDFFERSYSGRPVFQARSRRS
ncbi:MAG: tyrosine-type recombinase/integrase [Elusimicrobiota bacterium]